jgi:apolipoprotein D and lipocalin family protein
MKSVPRLLPPDAAPAASAVGTRAPVRSGSGGVSCARRRILQAGGALAAGGFGPFVAGCTSVPDGIEPVQGFELNRYLGRWYEIARLDHRFERGLSHVTARYAPHPDGGLEVINRGWSVAEGEWREARGRARFVQSPDTAHLKVSFFGPFYAAYVVFELDPGYRYAFVAGNSRDYLWLLSREPEIDEALYVHFLDRAVSLGFPTQELIRVEQRNRPPGEQTAVTSHASNTNSV